MVQIVILNEVKDLLRFFVALLLRMTIEEGRIKRVGKEGSIPHSKFRNLHSAIRSTSSIDWEAKWQAVGRRIIVPHKRQG
jgi:hypothetical protein